MRHKKYKIRIKQNDNIVIIAGKYKGREGTVNKIINKNNTAIIENINLKTKHIRPKRENEKGSIDKIAAPIHISNISLINK